MLVKEFTTVPLQVPSERAVLNDGSSDGPTAMDDW
jgi:hypothetical protein